ncbi:MAG: cytochrome P450 [Dehalococcoidia bacterium]
MSQAIADYHFLRLNEQVLKDPYPFYRELRNQAPIFREPDYGVFLVSRYQDIVEVNRQPEVFSSVLVANAPYVDLPAPIDELAKWRAEHPFGDKILSNDPPDHTRYKRLVNQFFTPRRVTAMEPRIRKTVNEVIDSFIDKGQVEFVTQFAHMIPRLIVGELIGVPPADAVRFRAFFEDRLAEMAKAAADPEHGFRARTTEAEGITENQFLMNYFMGAIGDRRKDPVGDIMSDLANAKFDDGTPVPIEHVVSMITLLYAAGGDANTPELMSNSLLVLLRNEALMRSLREDPSLAEPFIEEVLRYDTPVPGVFRVATRDASVGGVAVKKGEKVMVVYGAANHDEEVFEESEAFKLGREFKTPHLGFGVGVHFCPGASLARLEGKVAVQEVLRRMGNIRFAETPQPPYVPSVIQRIPIRIVLDFEKIG